MATPYPLSASLRIACCAVALSGCGGGGEEPLAIDGPLSAQAAPARSTRSAPLATLGASEPGAAVLMGTPDESPSPDAYEMMRDRYDHTPGAYEADAEQGAPQSFASQSGSLDLDAQAPVTVTDGDTGS